MEGFDQDPPEQPEALEQVALHRKKSSGHALEREVADELAREVDRRVIAMDGMVATLDAPLADREQQQWLSETFLELTSTPNGWWQETIEEGIPEASRMDRWAEKAQVWLDERRKLASA